MPAPVAAARQHCGPCRGFTKQRLEGREGWPSGLWAANIDIDDYQAMLRQRTGPVATADTDVVPGSVCLAQIGNGSDWGSRPAFGNGCLIPLPDPMHGVPTLREHGSSTKHTHIRPPERCASTKSRP